jgi:hypothetical protein
MAPPRPGTNGRPERRHSWHAPFEYHQVAPWVVLASSLGCFYGVCVPLQPDGWLWFIMAHVAITCIMLGCGIRVTALSPHVHPRFAGRTFAPNAQVAACPQCAIPRIVGSRTHHCYFCNRCADEFDHHCRWLNTCVAGSNYFWFLALVCAATSMFIVQLVFAGVTGPLMSPGLVAAAVVLSFLPFVAICLLGSVLAVHAYLCLVKGWTTQEYLVFRGEKRGAAELQREADRVESKREALDREAQLVREEWRRTRETEKAAAARKEARSLAAQHKPEDGPEPGQDPPGQELGMV